jgi:hypothetical protein
MYLTDMVHIYNQHPDSIEQDSLLLINFSKRHKWAEVIQAALRHQPKAYVGLAEDSVVMQYITDQLQTHTSTADAYWWLRSKELQLAEVSFCGLSGTNVLS